MQLRNGASFGSRKVTVQIFSEAYVGAGSRSLEWDLKRWPKTRNELPARLGEGDYEQNYTDDLFEFDIGGVLEASIRRFFVKERTGSNDISPKRYKENHEFVLSTFYLFPYAFDTAAIVLMHHRMLLRKIQQPTLHDFKEAYDKAEDVCRNLELSDDLLENFWIRGKCHED